MPLRNGRFRLLRLGGAIQLRRWTAGGGCPYMNFSRTSFAELLDFAEAFPTGFISWTGSIAAHAESVAVWLLNIHFTGAPGHLGRRLANEGAAFLVLLVPGVHVIHEIAHPLTGLTLSVF